MWSLSIESIVLIRFHRFLCQTAPDSSPRIGASRVAHVIIEKNDNANGIVQLSSSTVSVPEPYTGSVVNITRTAGAFGTVSDLNVHFSPDNVYHTFLLSLIMTSVAYMCITYLFADLCVL